MTNFELYTLIFSGIVTISTIVSLVLNYQLTREAKLTREHNDTPDINIYFKRAEADPSFVFIIFENIGLGYAKKVKFNILKDFNYYNHRIFNLTNKGIIINGKDNFAPSQKIEHFFTDLSSEHENKIKETLIIEVTYENIFAKKYKKVINLELKELVGESILNPPANYVGRIAYELKEIKTVLKEIRDKQEKQ